MTTTARRSWEIRMPWKAGADFKDPPIWGPGAARLSGSNGIYELADESLRVLYVGYAGSRARYGLRGKIVDHFSDHEPNPDIAGKARYFRYEVTSSYLSRWTEVIGRRNELGALPPANARAKELPRHMPYFGPQNTQATQTGRG